MKQGEIWWVCFNPSVGHEFKKKRPAVVITSSKVIKKINLIAVLPITSNKNNYLINDIVIKKDSDNQLFCDSIIKVSHISTFDKSKDRFIKKIGEVRDDIMKEIKKYLGIHFDLQ